MQVLARLSLYSLQFFIFLFICVAVTKGLQYLASETYTPGDRPNPRFRVAVVESLENGAADTVYSTLQWRSLAGLRNLVAEPDFYIGTREVMFKDDTGAHVTVRVMGENDKGQLVLVEWVGKGDETVSRYRVKGDEIVPLYFRRTSTSLAFRGAIVGLIVAGLAGIPLRRLMIAS